MESAIHEKNSNSFQVQTEMRQYLIKRAVFILPDTILLHLQFRIFLIESWTCITCDKYLLQTSKMSLRTDAATDAVVTSEN